MGILELLEDSRRILQNARNNADIVEEASRSRNLKVLLSLLGPAWRGLLLQLGKAAPMTKMELTQEARFDWGYTRDSTELSRLYEAAKDKQWDASKQLDWSISVDPHDNERELLLDDFNPLLDVPAYRDLPKHIQEQHRQSMLAWLLSQFLHGEQGALFAACQVTQAVEWTDGKLYGSTQVMDEGRHVEVFHRYIDEKLQKLYPINDNLFTVIDALMSDGRWDIKFLGMQIMIEGLALGAFGTLRATTREPLLRELLKYVITDEARHVHYGVLALRDFYTRQLEERERREREDWAFEMALLMRNRFRAHEVYEELYAHSMSRKEWNRLIARSPFMRLFRKTMFRRVVPNLKRIGLLTERIRPHYEALGMLVWENEKAAPELTAEELIADSEQDAYAVAPSLASPPHH